MRDNHKDSASTVSDWHKAIELGFKKEDLDSLKHQWKIMNDHLEAPFPENVGELIADANPMAAFYHLINAGRYPPPELLLSLWSCIQNYQKNAGSLSAEEALFGNVQKGVGNYAAHSKSISPVLHFNFQVAEEMRDGTYKNLTQSALNFVESNSLNIEPESLIRQYQRYQKRNR